MHPSVIIKGYREAMKSSIDRIREVSIKIADESIEGRRDILKKCAQTSLNSKIISNYKEFFADMVVKAVEHLEENLDKSLIGIKKVTGGSITDSFLVEGVAFRKTFSYAGFEQQPKKFENPKIAILNVELELKSERENAEVRLENPDDFQKVVDAEWKLIYEKLERSLQAVPRLFFQNSQLVILPHNTSQTATCSALAEFQVTILLVLRKPPEESFKQP
jgi:T-complex protein 1 subunit eta